MKENLETAAPEKRDGLRDKREVLKNSAAETHLIHAAPFPQTITNRFDGMRDRLVKAMGNIGGREACGDLPRNLPEHGTCVDHPRL